VTAVHPVEPSSLDQRGQGLIRASCSGSLAPPGLFELSRFMGTSVEQIGRTYGHRLPDSLERARTALDSFLVEGTQTASEGV
jgi:hypothetical protein